MNLPVALNALLVVTPVSFLAVQDKEDAWKAGGPELLPFAPLAQPTHTKQQLVPRPAFLVPQTPTRMEKLAKTWNRANAERATRDPLVQLEGAMISMNV